jgi:hypothetical protein
VNIVVKTGSGDKPFPINSAHELRALAGYGEHDSYHYILENDIDLTDGWSTIGYFAGFLDWDGHSITGINAPFAARIPSAGAVFRNIRFVLSDNASPVKQFTVAASQPFYGGIIAMEAMTLTLENVLIEGGYTFSDTTGTTFKYLGLAAGTIRKLNADNVTIKGYIDAGAAYTQIGLLAGNIGQDVSVLSTARNITVEGRINANPISSTSATSATLTGGGLPGALRVWISAAMPCVPILRRVIPSTLPADWRENSERITPLTDAILPERLCPITLQPAFAIWAGWQEIRQAA